MNGKMNGLALAGGIVGGTVLASLIGKQFVTVDMNARDQYAEARRIVRNAALLAGASAAGLGLAAGYAGEGPGASALLGGAVGTGVIAGLLGAILVQAPDRPPAPQQPPAVAPIPPPQVTPPVPPLLPATGQLFGAAWPAYAYARRW